jgi:dipeptidyl aminopeptidase/acylaminoacyl peptidase
MKNLLFLFLSVAGYCNAQTMEALLAPAFPSNLTASADGKHIAWIFNNKGSRNVFVADASGNNVKQITNYTGDDGMDMNSLAFTPGGTQLVFVRGNASNSKGEPANPAQLQQSTERMIHHVSTDGKEMRKIAAGYYPKVSPNGKMIAYLNSGQVWTASLTDTSIKPQKLFNARGSQASIRWNHDGTKLAFVSNRGDHSFIGIYDVNSKQVLFPDPSADTDTDPVWSADGQWIAFIRQPNVRVDVPFTPKRAGYPWSIRLLNVSTGKANELWKAEEGKGSVFVDDLPVADNKLLWAANNQLIFPWEKDGWIHMYALDVDKKTIKLLTPGEGEVENIVLSADKQSLYYTCNINDINRRHIWKTTIATATAELLTKGEQIEWSPVPTANGLALLRSSATKPAWPAVYSNGAVNDIAKDLFAKEYPTQLITPQQITIKATDGMDIPAQIFLPAGYKETAQYPAVIFLHGGSRRQMLLGFNYGAYYSNAYAAHQLFASKGFIVLSLNYRSGIGYGLDFREALNYGMSGASEVNDLIGAGEYLKQRKDVRKESIGLWGGSYGGYLTAHGLARRSDLFASGVDIHGVHNWNDEEPTFAPWYDSTKYAAIGKIGYESSPVNFINGWKSPVLFIHGDDDRNVPFSETVHIIELLRQRNVYFEQLVFPDEVHFMLLHRNWVRTYEATFEFLEKRLKK